MIARALLAVVLLVSGCATTGAADLAGDAPRLVGDGRFAVLVFFSQHCPTQRAHDARLVALAERFTARGVRFFAIASEPDLDERAAAEERSARNYPFPILVDRDARLADAAGARFSTHTIVIDAEGRTRYRGGIDSDATALHDDAAPWLADALEALIAGRVPSARGEPRGCVLARP